MNTYSMVIFMPLLKLTCRPNRVHPFAEVFELPNILFSILLRETLFLFECAPKLQVAGEVLLLFPSIQPALFPCLGVMICLEGLGPTPPRFPLPAGAAGRLCSCLPSCALPS